MILRASPHRLVILIDGDPVVISTVRKALRDEPVEVRATANPNRALKWMAETEAPLVLADPDMPAVQASDFIRVVEERFPEATFALLSSGSEDAPLGPPRVVTKPWDSGRFERAVLDLVHRGEVVPLVVPILSGERQEPGVFAQGQNVLLVHPRPQTASPLEIGLREEGFAVHVETARDALDLLRRAPLGTDVALLPAELAGPSVTNLVREMNRLSPGLTVFLLSGNWTRDQLREAYEAGAQNVVREEDPGSVVDLIRRSGRLIRDRRAAALRDAEKKGRRSRHGIRRVVNRAAEPRAKSTRRTVVLAALGLLLGAGLAVAIDVVLGGPTPTPTAMERVLSGLERALARDPFHESDFQRWYLLQRLDLERQINFSGRQAQDEQMRSNRLDGLFRDVRAADAPR